LYKLNAAETLSPTVELIILPVTHYALLQALQEIVPRLGAAGSGEFKLYLPPGRFLNVSKLSANWDQLSGHSYFLDVLRWPLLTSLAPPPIVSR
jgi:hypothetical protein